MGKANKQDKQATWAQRAARKQHQQQPQKLTGGMTLKFLITSSLPPVIAARFQAHEAEFSKMKATLVNPRSHRESLSRPAVASTPRNENSNYDSEASNKTYPLPRSCKKPTFWSRKYLATDYTTITPSSLEIKAIVRRNNYLHQGRHRNGTPRH